MEEIAQLQAYVERHPNRQDEYRREYEQEQKEQREWDEYVEGILDDYYQQEEDTRAARETTRLRSAEALNRHNHQKRQGKARQESNRQPNGRFGPAIQ